MQLPQLVAWLLCQCSYAVKVPPFNNEVLSLAEEKFTPTAPKSQSRFLSVTLKANGFVNPETDIGEVGAIEILDGSGACLTCDMADVCSSAAITLADADVNKACRGVFAPGKKWSWRVSEHSYDMRMDIPMDLLANGTVDFFVQVSTAVASSGSNTLEERNRQVSEWEVTAQLGTQKHHAWLKVPMVVNGDFDHKVTAKTLIRFPDGSEGLYNPVCNRPSADLLTNYTIVEETKLQKNYFLVNLQCAENYTGTPVASACDDHEEPYSVTGCEAQKCKLPPDTEGYVIGERNLDRPHFQMSVGCKAPWKGEAKPIACAGDNQYVGLTGCERPGCVSPSSTTGYVIEEVVSLKQDNLEVKMTCADMFKNPGVPVASPCDEPEGEFKLSGCDPEVCAQPLDDEGYELTPTSLQRTTFQVDVKCKHGFAGTAAKAESCGSHGAPYTVTGCVVQSCTAPDAATLQKYAVDIQNLQIPYWDVSLNATNAGCAPMHNGKAVLNICSTASTPFTLSGCQLDVCATPAEAAVGHEVYDVTVLTPTRLGFSVTAKCRDGYKGTAQVEACQAHGQPFTVVGCDPKECKPALSEEGYTVTTSSLQFPTFGVTAKCALGYTPQVANVPPQANRCNTDGEPITLTGCRAEVCEPPTSSTGYVVAAGGELQRPFFNMGEVTCAEKYFGLFPAAVNCTGDGMPYALQGCQEQECVAPADTTGYNLEILQPARPILHTTVSCSKPSYTGTATVSECTEHKGAVGLDGCDEIVCQPPVDDPAYNVTSTTSLHHSTLALDVECAEGYTGTATVTKCTETEPNVVLSGCKEQFCVAPTDTTGYDLTILEPARPRLQTTVSCSKPSYTGAAKAEHCLSDNGAVRLSGCDEIVCLPPEANENYTVISTTSLHHSTLALDVECADGYRGKAQYFKCTETKPNVILFGCSRINDACHQADGNDCGKGIYDIRKTGRCENHNGYLIEAGGNVVIREFFLKVSCTSEYKEISTGSAKANKCSEKDTPYTLSGCTPLMCIDPQEKGYLRTGDGDVPMPNFDLRDKYQCDTENFYKAAPGPLPEKCEGDGMPWKLSGCEPEVCKAPVSWPDGYVKKSEVLQRPSFHVEAECANYWTGVPNATDCGHDGHHYTISGCKRETCTVPAVEDAYTVTIADESRTLYRPWDTKGVNVVCSAGFHGTVQFADCEGGAEVTHLKLQGECKPIICKAPKEAKEYDVNSAGMVLDLPTGVSVDVKCATHYTGDAEFHACEHHDEHIRLSGCIPTLCKPPASKLGYHLSKEVKDMPNFDVKGKCADGFFGEPSVTPCKAHETEYILSGCKPITCQAPATTVGYKVTEMTLEKYQFAVDVKCATEFTGTAKAIPCDNNMDEYTLEGCTLQSCTRPTETEGYKITEHSLARTTFAVEVECEEDRVGTAMVTECGDPTESDPNPAYKLDGCTEK